MKTIFNIILLLVSFFGLSQEKFDALAAEKYQNHLNSEYADVKMSPLTPEDLATFKTLDFYPINEKFFVVAKFVRTDKEIPFEMPTSTDRKPMYIKYGEVYFEIDGIASKLNVYRSIDLSKRKEYESDLFLPFFDLSSGKESYIGGKYIDLKIPEGNTIAIDFNTSYNPYCAYSHRYSCPKVPMENDLNIDIKAGVKKFHD